MPESFYDDAPESGGMMTAEQEPEPHDESKEDTKTATIDSSICPGMKPGEEMVVKIEKVLDKEYLVSYAPEPEKGEEESAEAEAGGAPAEAQAGGGNPGMYD